MEFYKIKSVNVNGKTSKFRLQRKYFVNFNLRNNTLENKKKKHYPVSLITKKTDKFVEQTQPNLQTSLGFQTTSSSETILFDNFLKLKGNWLIG